MTTNRRRRQEVQRAASAGSRPGESSPGPGGSPPDRSASDNDLRRRALESDKALERYKGIRKADTLELIRLTVSLSVLIVVISGLLALVLYAAREAGLPPALWAGFTVAAGGALTGVAVRVLLAALPAQQNAPPDPGSGAGP
ncbi:hypothetical protein [Streptomyces aidingensis]|uniref:Holin-X, holin superfamily III n=1 Tax=Streptomyces aidingensis TaxID=910347 RepID=A0A1I1M0X2_9ACTN|nr:hypothetical protein [Streptomyces aidingensis]SFC79011.1 hypothetical protein SAMN05421773_10651 [Streptomyces aidingensis]